MKIEGVLRIRATVLSALKSIEGFVRRKHSYVEILCVCALLNTGTSGVDLARVISGAIEKQALERFSKSWLTDGLHVM